MNASHYNIMPLAMGEDRLVLATCDSFDADLRREIELLVLSGVHRVEYALATGAAIKITIRKSYGLGAATVEQMVTSEGLLDAQPREENPSDENKASEASVMKLVNQLLADAIASGTTDVHIEPYGHNLRVLYRIDGILHDAGVPSSFRYFREGITDRIKIMSGLDIAERRLPQDGRARCDADHLSRLGLCQVPQCETLAGREHGLSLGGQCAAGGPEPVPPDPDVQSTTAVDQRDGHAA